MSRECVVLYGGSRTGGRWARRAPERHKVVRGTFVKGKLRRPQCQVGWVSWTRHESRPDKVLPRGVCCSRKSEGTEPNTKKKRRKFNFHIKCMSF